MAFSREKTQALNVEEICELLTELSEEELEDAHVAVLPPDRVDYLTDEDEVEEDDLLGAAIVEDVPGDVELFCSITDEQDLEIPTASHLINSSSSLPVSKPVPDDSFCSSNTKHCTISRPKGEKNNFPHCESARKNVVRNWKKEDLVSTNLGPESQISHLFLQRLQDTVGGLTPAQIYSQIVSNDLIEWIVRETRRYATCSKNEANFEFSVEECKVFLGILLFTGYHQLPNLKNYWSSDEDLGIQFIKNAMSRNRFQKLKSMIHFNDNALINNETKTDKAFKIRPLIEKINEGFMKFGVFESNLAVDEMIIKYFGHNNLKQYIRGKPIRFGYKFWALCGTNGFCYKFDLYQGREVGGDSMLSLGTRVVESMLIDTIPEPAGYKIYFDNFFTSFELLDELTEMGIRCTGTMRSNRTRNCPLLDIKDIKKMERGVFDYYSDLEDKILIVRWNDNSPVTVASNFESIFPLQGTQRYSRTKKRKVEIQQPNLVMSYNKNMGGVDKHDWLCSKYSISVKGKKWYWSIVIRCFDMAVVNSWIIHKLVTDKKDQLNLLDFRREITCTLIKCNTNVISPGRRLTYGINKVVEDVRFDRKDHFISRREKQRRCQYMKCRAKPRTFCSKCNVTLCAECFIKYHNK